MTTQTLSGCIKQHGLLGPASSRDGMSLLGCKTYEEFALYWLEYDQIHSFEVKETLGTNQHDVVPSASTWNWKRAYNSSLLGQCLARNHPKLMLNTIS